MNAQQEEILDRVTELYQVIEDMRTGKVDVSEDAKAAGAILADAIATAFAKIHRKFSPNIPGTTTPQIRDEFQTVTLSLRQLNALHDRAVLKGSTLDDLVHIVADDQLTSAYCIHPHLSAPARQIFTSPSITSK